MIELILAQLADDGARSSRTTRKRCSTSSPTSPGATSASGSSSAITIRPSAVGTFTEPVQDHRPGQRREQRQPALHRAEADAIVDAALDAGDAIDAALAAPTKQETVRYWQKVFGSSFQV